MSHVVDCAYCGLPVPGARPDDSGQPQYCCYGCSLAVRITIGGPGATSPNLTRTRTLLGVAIFLSMNVMVVNWMLYGQEVYAPGAEQPGGLPAHIVSLFRYLSMLFAAPVLVILGWPIFESGIRTLRSGRITTDLLIALGAVAAFVTSYVSVMRESGSTYFDTVCMILVLVTLGKYMEATAKIKTTSAIHDLERLLPETVTVRRKGSWVEAPLNEIGVGDVVRVLPGSRVPADGVICENESHVDEQLVTGESTPVLKRCGDRVFAGSLNGDGTISVEVRAVGDGTVLHEVIDLLLAARRSKGRYERLADRLAAVFVPGVLLLAFLAGVFAYSEHGVNGAIMRTLAVLLISCPCALGLATPMAIWVALGRSARKGVLFRNVVAMELLARVRRVCFDKTGTLTTGQAAVASFDAHPDGDKDVALAAAASLARQATHHLSAGIVQYADDQHTAAGETTAVQSVPGRGVTGEVDLVGSRVSLGSPAFMADQNLATNEAMQATIDRLEGEARPIACVGWDGAVRGVFAFDEDLRPEACGVLDWLRARGLSLRILTGDHKRRAEQLAERLGVAVEANLLPADKIDRVRALASSRQPVAMVGDGINDAPALAAADVGIAMGCGADVTRESADVTLASNDLSMLPWSISLSARTIRVIKQNLFWAFGYNTVGIGLAMSGKLSPIFAAIAMVVSSFLVVTNSLRLNHVDLSLADADRSPSGRG